MNSGYDLPPEMVPLTELDLPVYGIVLLIRERASWRTCSAGGLWQASVSLTP